MRYFVLLIVALIPLSQVSADPFYPVWKLLDSEQKQQFIAGYILGWQDAKDVSDIALEFVKKNPDKAIQSLESIRAVYDLRELKPSILMGAIDAFYSDLGNQGKSLSQAISSAKRSG